jgi:hypothetical protein
VDFASTHFTSRLNTLYLVVSKNGCTRAEPVCTHYLFEKSEYLQKSSEPSDVRCNKQRKGNVEGKEYNVQKKNEVYFYVFDIGENQILRKEQISQNNNIENNKFCDPAKPERKPFEIFFQYRIEAEKEKVHKSDRFCRQQ